MPNGRLPLQSARRSSGRAAARWSAIPFTTMIAVACTDSFTVTMPYEQAWDTCTETLVGGGFEMVREPDAKRMIPASSEPSGRAWFLATAMPDRAGWEAPRVVQVSIEPVEPRGEAERRITVEVEKRDWVVEGDVPDPELRSRVVWMLKQALGAPVAVPPEDPPRR